jgi:lipoprotein NlpI
VEVDPTMIDARLLANAHWRLGQIYPASARRELARAEYNESLRINPQNQAVGESLEVLK